MKKISDLLLELWTIYCIGIVFVLGVSLLQEGEWYLMLIAVIVMVTYKIIDKWRSRKK